MSEYRENLLDRLIKVYGFEHKVVIEFAKLFEEYEDNVLNDLILAAIVSKHELTPVIEDVE